jgi:hypothetical protein
MFLEMLLTSWTLMKAGVPAVERRQLRCLKNINVTNVTPKGALGISLSYYTKDSIRNHALVSIYVRNAAKQTAVLEDFYGIHTWPIIVLDLLE